MNTLFFTVQNRRSLLPTRLVYGLEGMKYIIQIYEGEINGHGEKERLPEEFQYEFEQEMLKHIHELKNELREKGWTQRDASPEVHQPWFLRCDESDAQLGFKFEWTYHADIDHLFLLYPSSNSTKIYIICPVYQNISVPT